MSLFRVIAALVLCFAALPATAQTIAQAPSGSQIVASADSPSHIVHVDVTLNAEGRVGYLVSRQGKPVILESRLGFLFTDAPEMLRNFAFAGQSTRSFDETWEEPWGEYRSIRDHYNELTVSFDETKWLKRRMTVVFRLFDDGIGFRYELPSAPNFTHANIADELTEFDIAEPGTAWWDEALEWNREEYLYRRTPIEEIGTAQTPLTIRTSSGLHLSIHEAALVDYSGMDLQARFRSGPESQSHALLDGSEGQPRAAARNAVARDHDRRRCTRTLQIGADHPQPQRAEQARRRQLGQADEICRHLVGNAPRQGDLELRAEARRHHRERQALHRLRGQERLPRRARRGLEQRLGRRLVRERHGTSASREPTPTSTSPRSLPMRERRACT